jgi:GT2 family glycosyltransferase
LSRYRFLARWLDAMTPRPGVLVGANASAWKNDVLAVNGFDETYTYGSDDKDLGVRMSNNGVKSRRLKYSLVCVHLAHPRAYASPERVLENKHKLRQVRAERITWTRHGICAGRREAGAPQEPLITPPVPNRNPALPDCGVA